MRSRPRHAALVAVPLLLVLGTGPVLAQYEDDEQTEEHKRQDEEYMRRYLKPEEQQSPAAPPAGADPAELSRAFFARAEELIRDQNYRSTDEGHYRIQTDDPRLNVTSVAHLLEDFRAHFDATWSVAADPVAQDARTRVLLFYSYHDYDLLLGGDWSRNLLRPKGHYGSTFGAIVVHTDSDRPGGLPNTLVHEAAHELVDQRVFGGSILPSPWLAEGLATYYENMYMDADGRFRDDEIGGKEIAVFHGERPRAASDARERIRRTRQHLDEAAKEGTSPVADLVSTDDPRQFYAADPLANYDLAWLLIHYLLHGDEGTHAPAFARYVRLESQGQGGAVALFAELGMTAPELDAAVRAHLKGLKVH